MTRDLVVCQLRLWRRTSKSESCIDRYLVERLAQRHHHNTSPFVSLVLALTLRIDRSYLRSRLSRFNLRAHLCQSRGQTVDSVGLLGQLGFESLVSC